MSRKTDHAATRALPPSRAPEREPAPMPVPHNAPRTPALIPESCMPPRTQPPHVPTLTPDDLHRQQEAMHLTI